MFPIRNGLKQVDALLPLPFNVALEYAIRRVQVNQHGLRLNGTLQHLIYAADVNILGGDIYRISQPIRHHFFPEKCDLNSNCVLYTVGKYLFPNL
jgi:hypothetical protein